MGIFQEVSAPNVTIGNGRGVTGTIQMAIYMSDAYTWISKIDASGSFERNPPIIAYYEASSLPQAAFCRLWCQVRQED
jgi:hypothetical protein